MLEMVTSLADLNPGQMAVVRNLKEDGSDSLRLLEMGLLPGTEIRFIRKAPFGGPLEVEIRGFRLSLRRREASAIAVELR